MTKQFLLLIGIVLSCSNKDELPEPMGYIDRTFMPSGSKAVIFIDFRGGYVHSTRWQVDSVANAGIKPSGQQIVFDTVLNDFKGLKIAITTNKELFQSVPIKYKMRVIVTQDFSWAGGEVGGLGYDGSILAAESAPCFVFPARLENDPRWIAKTISHEVGHTFGLSHQVQANAIMSTGIYSSCKIFLAGYNVKGQWQDDIGIIQSVLQK